VSLSIPRTADDLTAEWCTAALGRPISTARTEPMGVGVGLVGQLFHLDVDGPDGAQRMVAKLAAPTEESRFVATVLNMYGREKGFYTELADATPIRHPACYHAAHDPETQDAVLLLEDVSGSGHAFDQVAGASVDEVRPAIRTLARLHAAYWDEAGLDGRDWLLRLCDDPYPGSVAFAFETAWPVILDIFAMEITPEVRAFAETYTERVPALFAKLSEPPLVLAHADWRLDNLFFAPEGDVIALDWQLIDRSVGPRDLAYLVTQSLEIHDRSGYEQAYATYVGDLRELGVDVDEAWAWEMYRYGTMLGFAYPVIAGGALTIEDPRHVQLVRALFVRSIRALTELDAFDLPL
jgi:hypothetical protein